MPIQLVESPPPMESPSQMIFPNGVSQSPPRHARRRDSSESSSESSSSDAPSLDTILSSATAATLVGDAPWRGKTREWISNPQPDDPSRKRTLVLCFDGTGDQFDHDNSNIVQLVSLLKKDDPTKQLIYYQTGIGTYTSADMMLSGVRNTSKSLDLMLATTLGHHVRDGYEFLCQNYTEGDLICIFGFSRGAYTARALAGMLQKIGLLPAWNKQQMPFAYHMYANEHEADFCAEYKNTFCTDVKVEFVGVWDTVSSVGLIPRHLPFIRTNTSIHYFRHALALDEHRAKFQPSLYHKPEDLLSDDDDSYTLSEASQAMVRDVERLIADGQLHERARDLAAQLAARASALDLKKTKIKKRRPIREKTSEAFELERLINGDEESIETDVQEVWFAGVHTDVGGGSVANNTRHSLARISLRWMIRECFKARTGLLFDKHKLRDDVGLGIDWNENKIRDPPEPISIAEKQKYWKSRLIVPPEPNYLQKAWSKVTTPVCNLYNTARSSFWGMLGYPVTEVQAPSPIVPDHDSVLEDLIQQLKTDPTTAERYKSLRSAHKGEAMEDLLDALSPMYDQLHYSPSWWFLEWIPLWVKKEKAIIAQETSHIKGHEFRINNGKGRKLFKHVVKRGIHVHRTVLTRILALDHLGRPGTYVPLIRPKIKGRTKGKADPTPMTWQEWVTGKVEGTDQTWVKWVQ